MFDPRPAQERVLRYRQGKMGVVAVPGSGKTLTLSWLAAEIIARGSLGEGQEVLIVTLVNSAVENFSARIAGFVRGSQAGLLPAYRVRTLHGLAHDIVRERPALVDLSEDFTILDERATDEIRDSVALSWLQGHPDELGEYLDPDLDENRREWLRRERLPDLVREIALGFIRYAKDHQITPANLRHALDQVPLPLPLAEMGAAMYLQYQQALAYRGAVDFDDLIRLALLALNRDPAYLARLRQRWPYILEDEAQDSSRLQEQILALLVGETGNWVRVGDPNQAIYETFTTASPRYLRDFKQRAHFWHDLPNSGRSTRSIIDLANHLIDWTTERHPVEPVRDALSVPHIEPTPPGDPQPNPPDDPEKVVLVEQNFSPRDEIEAVVDSLARWLPKHPHETVAALVPRNQRGFQLVDALRKRGIEPVDSLLRSTTSTRFTAGALGNLLKYLCDPGSASKLATVYQVWRRAARDDPEQRAFVKRTAEVLRGNHQVEDFLWPRLDQDWLEASGLAGENPELYQELVDFRHQVQRWTGTVHLPIDQIVLTLAQELFTEPHELAIAHKLAVLLRRTSSLHQDWRLPEMTEELALIARNERRFLGFSEDDAGFDPDQYPGQVVVATSHKAKGLEWDRVYLLSVNNYDFPSGQVYDRFIAEKWYLRDHLNLPAEALAQLKATHQPDEYQWYEPGVASQDARLEYARERLRLLYVGITRARRELVITWNTGRRGDLQPALPLVALQEFWQNRLQHSAGNGT